jgi:Fungal N-terminal domain of STAND proteins
MDPATALGVAGAVAQFAEQALKISDCLYQYFKSVKNAPAKSRELRQEALLLSDVLETLTDLFSAQNKPSVLPNAGKYADMLKEFRETMADMAKKVEIKKGELTFKRLAWPFTEKENGNYLTKMERFKSSFQLALQALQSYDFPHFVLICQFKVGQYRMSRASN